MLLASHSARHAQGTKHSRPSTIFPLYLVRATAASPGRVNETMAIPRDLPWELYTMRTSFTGPTVLEKRICAARPQVEGDRGFAKFERMVSHPAATMGCATTDALRLRSPQRLEGVGSEGSCCRPQAQSRMLQLEHWASRRGQGGLLGFRGYGVCVNGSYSGEGDSSASCTVFSSK